MANTRGGKRKGAGRPRVPDDVRTVSVTVRLPAWMADWLREAPESQASVVRQALIDQYNLSPPESVD